MKDDSIGLLLGFLKQASGEVLIRYKFRKPLNVRFVVAVTCNFTSYWNVKVFCICLKEELECKTRINFASVEVHFLDLVIVGVISTNEYCSIFSCNDPAAFTL